MTPAAGGGAPQPERPAARRRASNATQRAEGSAAVGFVVQDAEFSEAAMHDSSVLCAVAHANGRLYSGGARGDVVQLVYADPFADATAGTAVDAALGAGGVVLRDHARRAGGAAAATVANIGQVASALRHVNSGVCAGRLLVLQPALLRLHVLLRPVRHALFECSLTPARGGSERGERCSAALHCHDGGGVSGARARVRVCVCSRRGVAAPPATTCRRRLGQRRRQ
jgi:hypothetical protein